MTNRHERPTHAYIGRCRGCNRVLASCAEMRCDLRDVGRSVAEMIASDLTVERVLMSDAMLDFGDCQCPRTVQETMPL